MFKGPINAWWTVAAGALGVGVGAGLFVVYVLSVMTKPIVADLGFDRSVLSFSATCFLIANGLGALSLGVLISRWGVRLPSVIYLIISSACVALIPFLPPQSWIFYVVFAIFGMAGAAATALPYAVAIAGLFDERRGLALGVAVAGGGVGATFGPQLANYLLGVLTWREAMWIVSAIMALPIFTMIMLVRTPPSVTAAQGAVQRSESHWSLYLGKKSFWLIAVTIVGISVGVFGVLAILVPLLTDRGLSPGQAATVLSAAGLSSWVGRIGAGWILDRVWGPLVTSVICIAACVGVLAIAFGGTSIPLLAFGASLMGMALGAEADLLTYLCSRYFSLQSFSRAVGAGWIMWAWGGGLGTAMGGIAYKFTGAYDTAMVFLAGPLIVGAAAVLLLGPYAYPPAHRKQPTTLGQYKEA